MFRTAINFLVKSSKSVGGEVSSSAAEGRFDSSSSSPLDFVRNAAAATAAPVTTAAGSGPPPSLLFSPPSPPPAPPPSDFTRSPIAANHPGAASNAPPTPSPRLPAASLAFSAAPLSETPKEESVVPAEFLKDERVVPALASHGDSVSVAKSKKSAAASWASVMIAEVCFRSSMRVGCQRSAMCVWWGR